MFGDWIRLKRAEKNLTSGHMPAKMCIADSVVRSWADGNSQPDNKQLTFWANFFGSDPKKEANIAALLFLGQSGTPQSVWLPAVETNKFETRVRFHPLASSIINGLQNCASEVPVNWLLMDRPI